MRGSWRSGWGRSVRKGLHRHVHSIFTVNIRRASELVSSGSAEELASSGDVNELASSGDVEEVASSGDVEEVARKRVMET